MRSVLLIVTLLAATVSANPTRSRREEDSVEESHLPFKADAALLDIPEPGPIDASDISAESTVPIKSLDAIPDPPAKVPSSSSSPAAAAEKSTATKTPGSEEIDKPDKYSTPAGIFDFLPEEPTVEVCDNHTAPGRSKVYCSGRLLASVNLHHIFPDSKTFVDRPMKVNRTEDEIMADFESRFPKDNLDIDPEQLRAFVEQNFDQEGHELEQCDVPDWIPSPPAFDDIADPEMKKFALDLHNIWKNLCRRISPMVRDEPQRFSLLHVPNNFIAPGGRFREFYYWDTYWVIKGLIASGMYETTRGMLENLGSIVDRFGFIPNGGRVYYLKRSQPPLLTAMVYEYYEVTRNKTFLQEMLPLLEKEFEFWRSERSVDVEIGGINHTVFQYRTAANVPRPESYREDVSIANIFPSNGRKQLFYKDIGSAAESGWDFSTRWFADHKSITSIHTTDIVPVDLNAFLCYNLNIMSFFHGELRNFNKERAWLNDYNAFKTSFREVFHVPEAKGWYDYNNKRGEHNTDFFPSIAVPLFTGCFDQLSLTQSSDLLDRMTEVGALTYAGGVPTSLANNTQEQWDFPNGWSPLNHMIIEGMRKSDNPRLQQAAFSLAQKWVRANLHVYKLDHAMWEKYNVATNEARGGGGGEYEVQAGFGWTNGVVLDLLLSYGDRLFVDDSTTPAPKSDSPTTVPSSAASASAIVSEPKTTTGSASSSTTVFHILFITLVAAIANWC
ncbi:hypothetical protein PFISCL1PPCAC_24627 [Pristionchus fissidentatus]|uniref:Trehalase n=1 Tax=Pristionchus fissidentatus TaxID=1538716 RepID=A0AAV5WS00_9BILA|nr:hypothetical protein PFISCL1PPCAC_24627 [Pristionchus fissidentatus]